MSSKPEELTGGRRLARNVTWNLGGAAIPLVFALIAIPVLVRELGTERFGVLTLAWALVGYFSLFDLGLGRAVTKLVAEKLGMGASADVPALARTALMMMVGLGAVSATAIAVVSRPLVVEVLNIPSELQPEAVRAFLILAATVPFVITSAGFTGLLAAYQRFELINRVRIPTGVLNYLGPLAVLPLTSDLAAVVAVVAFTRLGAWSVHFRYCLRVVPAIRTRTSPPPGTVRHLLGFGGWMTLTNVISPVMTYLDRFLLGAWLSMTAVAYYATPFEVVARLWIFPDALMGVLFPALATALALNPRRATRLFNRTVTAVFLALFAAVLPIVTLAVQGLDLWLGPEFAANSGMVLQILAVGVLVNSLAYVPFGLLHANGRPDLTAKLHLFELPVYLLMLWFLVAEWGVVGAAIAWTGRVAIDAAVLFVMVRGTIRIPFGGTRTVLVGWLALSALVVGTQLQTLTSKLWFLSAAELVVIVSGFVWMRSAVGARVPPT